jgi:hypothetical protein
MREPIGNGHRSRQPGRPAPIASKLAMHIRFRPFLAPCALAIALSACSSTPKPLYQQEQFDAASSPYTRTFHDRSAATCEAARRALLSQGYITNLSRADAVDGSKNFQPSNDTHVVIEFHVVCADANADGTASIAYVNAVQDRYSLKKTNTSASVGLSVFGSLSLPIGSSDDAMVKTASETIPAGVFYDRFFNLVDHFLKIDPARRDNATVKAAEKEPVVPLPEPAATPEGAPLKLETPAAPGAQAEPPPGAHAGAGAAAPGGLGVSAVVAPAAAAAVPASMPAGAGAPASAPVGAPASAHVYAPALATPASTPVGMPAPASGNAPALAAPASAPALAAPASAPVNAPAFAVPASTPANAQAPAAPASAPANAPALGVPGSTSASTAIGTPAATAAPETTPTHAAPDAFPAPASSPTATPNAASLPAAAAPSASAASAAEPAAPPVSASTPANSGAPQ